MHLPGDPIWLGPEELDRLERLAKDEIEELERRLELLRSVLDLVQEVRRLRWQLRVRRGGESAGRATGEA